MTDEEIVHVAMLNSYDVLVKKDDVDLFLETDESYFAHDISTLITNDELADMISYWQELEEYERCSELIKLMKVI